MQPPTSYSLEVNPRVPKRLERLEELANNLWYSWNRPTRSLFARMNPALWDAVGHCPKAMLKRIDEQRLIDAAADPAFLDSLTRVLAAFDAYHAEPPFKQNSGGFRPEDLVAYFCAEFGVHESLPLYSGGLGILAGDHCKAASDFQLPFVGVGLLYRQGYFVQTIGAEGKQRAEYHDSDFDDLPIEPVTRKDGAELVFALAFPGRALHVKVWQARVGHVRLFFLDTDIAQNNERDRAIAHRLYGGDRTTRVEQELVLGVGGVRALEVLELAPTVWHINEGHAAFMILERVRALVASGLALEAAVEAVAASTVFTTHTPVPAGHDQFAEGVVMPYLSSCFGELGASAEKLAALARPPAGGDFNMTALALRGSRFQNGVSRIHGGVSARMLKDYWPEVSAAENPVSYVTNGVHVATFLAPEWGEVLDRFLGVGWMHRLGYPGIWEKIRDIPDHIFWSVRQDIKARLFHMLRYRVAQQHLRNHGSESHLERMLRYADPGKPNVLTIGFGRRFATYKRATLLFNDLDVLRRILSDKERPVLFLFAGKAHPADEPGQELIRTLVHMAGQDEFMGKLVFIEGYDLHIARRLVSGVDVWLNNPVHPLEASGTSGMKAGINGVVNLSILDGWWDEGYDGENGWAIKPASPHFDPHRRDREEARTLYELLQDSVIPLYYNGAEGGYSARWIRMAKRAMASLLPRYDASRMLGEYVSRFYLPAARQGHRYAANGFEAARALAAWKAKVHAAWPGVSARRLDAPRVRIQFGESVPVEVAVKLNGLSPSDVCVELLLWRGLRESPALRHSHELAPAGRMESGEEKYVLELKPGLSGRLDYRIRVVPRHELLTHPFELGLTRWV
ncbi:MAG TPA: alpha-glucan family phosphorylase [Burkholderiales bacterium]|nr:alpha-glucan family phosphorylase [Burkholderiales bacterium]